MKRLVLIFIILNAATVRAEDAISMATFLKEVETQNLTLKASQASVEAAKSRSVGVNLPQPMVGITQMRDASGSAIGIEVNQTIPFPSKLSMDRSARNFEAEAEKVESRGLKVEVLAKARVIYISVWSAQEKIQFLREKRTAIQDHLKLSHASTRSDPSLIIHTLKAESDLDLLENEVLEAEQSLREQQIIFAEFARKNPADYKPTLVKPAVSSVPAVKTLSTPYQLDAKKLTLEKLSAREAEAKASWYPDLNLRYRDVGGTPMTPGFREMMVGVTLPFVFFWEPKSTSLSASAEKLKGAAEYAQETLSIEAKISSLLARAESLKKQLDLISDRLLPRAEKRMRLVHNLAPRDIESLQDHREAMETFPELKLKALELRMQYENAIAELASFSSESQEKQ
jgi:outer membrane protein TolC